MLFSHKYREIYPDKTNYHWESKPVEQDHIKFLARLG